MSMTDVITLLNDTENTLIRRRGSTTDPTEKSALTAEIERVRQMRDMVDLLGLLDAAATLNELTGVIEAAAAALRAQPFDAILGAYQSLLDRIGETTGRIVRLEKPAVAEETVAEASAPTPLAAAASESTAPATEAPERLAEMYATCEPRAEKLAEIDRFYVQPMVRNRGIYEMVGARLAIPWWFIGVIHGLESGFSLSTHLHNGDPLTARTVHVPAHRPAFGTPPFTWLESAIDAMELKEFDGLADWWIGVTLDRLERYNGLGYRRHGLPSPYLWSFSQHYEKGKFVADGRFDPEAVSRQCGGAVLMRRLEASGIIDTARPLDADSGAIAAMRMGLSATAPAAVALTAENATPLSAELDLPAFVKKWAQAELDFPGQIVRGTKDKGRERMVHRVQEWCCFHNCQTAIDGDFGAGTEASVRDFQRRAGLAESGTVDERTWARLTEPMQASFGPVPVAPGDTLYDVVLRIARRHLEIHPIEFTVKGDGNRGPWVRLFMHGREGSDQPWCAGFVCHVIGQAAHALGQPMPIKRQVGVDALVADAKEDGRFLEGATLKTGEKRVDAIRRGALFVVRRTATDWTHVGFVTDVGGERFKTIEGNTNDAGSADGFEVCARQRGYGSRDFVLLI